MPRKIQPSSVPSKYAVDNGTNGSISVQVQSREKQGFSDFSQEQNISELYDVPKIRYARNRSESKSSVHEDDILADNEIELPHPSKDHSTPPKPKEKPVLREPVYLGGSRPVGASRPGSARSRSNSARIHIPEHSDHRPPVIASTPTTSISLEEQTSHNSHHHQQQQYEQEIPVILESDLPRPTTARSTVSTTSNRSLKSARSGVSNRTSKEIKSNEHEAISLSDYSLSQPVTRRSNSSQRSLTGNYASLPEPMDLEEIPNIPSPIPQSTGPNIVFKGAVLWKIPYGSKSGPKKRFFQVVMSDKFMSKNNLVLQWTDPNKQKKARCLALHTVKSVTEGHRSQAFLKQVKKRGEMNVPPPKLCITLHASKRTVDIAAFNMEQFQDWIVGLRNCVFHDGRMNPNVQINRVDPLAEAVSNNNPTNNNNMISPANKSYNSSNFNGESTQRINNPSLLVIERWTQQLFPYIEGGMLEQFINVLEEGCSIEVESSSNGDTPLLRACRCGQVEIVKECWRRGAKNRPIPVNGRLSGFLLAVKNSHVYCAHEIISLAQERGMVEHLFHETAPNGDTCLHIAAESGDASMVVMLLASGVDIFLPSANARSALHAACYKGELKSTQVLVDEAYELLDLGDSFGNTPLHGAVVAKAQEIVEYLLGSGAECNLANDDGFTAFMLARHLGNLDAMAFLRKFKGHKKNIKKPVKLLAYGKKKKKNKKQTLVPTDSSDDNNSDSVSVNSDSEESSNSDSDFDYGKDRHRSHSRRSSVTHKSRRPSSSRHRSNSGNSQNMKRSHSTTHRSGKNHKHGLSSARTTLSEEYDGYDTRRSRASSHSSDGNGGKKSLKRRLFSHNPTERMKKLIKKMTGKDNKKDDFDSPVASPRLDIPRPVRSSSRRATDGLFAGMQYGSSTHRSRDNHHHHQHHHHQQQQEQEQRIEEGSHYGESDNDGYYTPAAASTPQSYYGQSQHQPQQWDENSQQYYEGSYNSATSGGTYDNNGYEQQGYQGPWPNATQDWYGSSDGQQQHQQQQQTQWDNSQDQYYSQPPLPPTPAPQEEPEADRWEKHYTDDGIPYYFNATTQQSQWEDPRFQTTESTSYNEDNNVYQQQQKQEDYQYSYDGYTTERLPEDNTIQQQQQQQQQYYTNQHYYDENNTQEEYFQKQQQEEQVQQQAWTENNTNEKMSESESHSARHKPHIHVNIDSPAGTPSAERGFRTPQTQRTVHMSGIKPRLSPKEAYLASKEKDKSGRNNIDVKPLNLDFEQQQQQSQHSQPQHSPKSSSSTSQNFNSSPPSEMSPRAIVARNTKPSSNIENSRSRSNIINSNVASPLPPSKNSQESGAGRINSSSPRTMMHKMIKSRNMFSESKNEDESKSMPSPPNPVTTSQIHNRSPQKSPPPRSIPQPQEPIRKSPKPVQNVPNPASNDSVEKKSQFTDAELAPYRKMLKVGIPAGGVKGKMIQNGLKPEKAEEMIGFLCNGDVNGICTSLPAELSQKQCENEETEKKIKEEKDKDKEIEKKLAPYRKMMKFGVPAGGVKMKMIQNGINEKEAMKLMTVLCPNEFKPLPSPKKIKPPSIEEIEKDPFYARFIKMKKFGVPLGGVKGKMVQDGVPQDKIDIFMSAYGQGPSVPKGPPPSGARKSLVNLHWDALPPEKLEKTIFSKTSMGKTLTAEDQKNLEELFQRKPATKKLERKNSTSSMNKAPKILASNRAKNVEIVCRKFRSNFANWKDVSIALASGNLVKLDGERCEQLEECLKNERDNIALKRLKVSDDTAPSEAFLCEVLTVPRALEKVKCLLFMHQCGDITKELSKNINTILSASVEILDCESFLPLLKMVLDIGNAMNRGEDVGGFTLASLLKLSHTRSPVDKSMTILDFVTQTLHSKGSKVFSEFGSFPHLSLVQRIVESECSVALRDLKKRLASCETELKHCANELTEASNNNGDDESDDDDDEDEKEPPVDDGNPMAALMAAIRSRGGKSKKKPKKKNTLPKGGSSGEVGKFHDRLQAFIDDASAKVDSMDSLLEKALSKLVQLKEYFGEPVTADSGKVFSMISEFVMTFDKSRRAFLQKLERKERQKNRLSTNTGSETPSRHNRPMTARNNGGNRLGYGRFSNNSKDNNEDARSSLLTGMLSARGAGPSRRF